MNLPVNQGVVRVSITEVDPRPGLRTVKPTEPPGALKEAMSPNRRLGAGAQCYGPGPCGRQTSSPRPRSAPVTSPTPVPG
jgi:hypothetical protein